MADAADQITGLLPTVVAGGVAIKMTQSLFGSPQQTRRRKGKGKARKSSGGSPWSGNPMGGSKPW
jgi:hypothetical protein